MHQTVISDLGIGLPKAFIYVVYCPNPEVIYVGETRSSGGMLGRLGQHVSNERGTFRQRISTLFALDNCEGISVICMCYELSSRKSFQLRESGYRRGVEYLVQQELFKSRDRNEISGFVVSRVQPSEYRKLKYVRTEANSIAKALIKQLKSHQRSLANGSVRVALAM